MTKRKVGRPKGSATKTRKSTVWETSKIEEEHTEWLFEIIKQSNKVIYQTYLKGFYNGIGVEEKLFKKNGKK